MIRVSEKTVKAFQLELRARELFSDIYDWVGQVYGENNADRIMEEDFDCLLSTIRSIEEHRNEIITWAICNTQNSNSPELII